MITIPFIADASQAKQHGNCSLCSEFFANDYQLESEGWYSFVSFGIGKDQKNQCGSLYVCPKCAPALSVMAESLKISPLRTFGRFCAKLVRRWLRDA